MNDTDSDCEYQIKLFTMRGASRTFAIAVTNLLDLYSMEAYTGGNGIGGSVWRVQYQKHSYKLHYCTVPGDWTSMQAWMATCREVEARYGHLD